MIAALINYWLHRIGTKSKQIKTQLLCATFYGLLHFYGVRGTFLILMKARQLQNVNKRAVPGVRQGSHPKR